MKPLHFIGVESVEVKITDIAILKFNFEFIEILRGKTIRAIEDFNATDTSRSPNNKDIINDAAFKDGFLVISVGDREQINRIPLASLRVAQTNGILKKFLLKGIDWQKSYILFSRPTNLVLDEVVLFTFYY